MGIGVVVIGAGPIGLAVTKQIRARPSLVLHGVVDVDPQKLGSEIDGVKITAHIPDGAQVAVLTTTSSLSKITPLLLDVIARGLPVVSTCEELAWPFAQPALAAQIDDAARKKGVAVLGTGVNPGYLMDALPLFLTAPCERVDRVRVERIQDAATRRRPFQDKIGVGRAPDDVKRELDAGTTGHVGLRESAAMLSKHLGFAVDDFSEAASVVVADAAIERAGRQLSAGQVLGVEQVGRASVGGSVVVELFFRAVFFADDASALREARDRIVVEGSPALDVTIAGGVAGDVATAAIVSNAIPSILDAKPGLRTMADMPLVHFRR